MNNISDSIYNYTREIAGVSKRKWVDEFDKRSNAAKKHKSYVEEEIKPSGGIYS